MTNPIEIERLCFVLGCLLLAGMGILAFAVGA